MSCVTEARNEQQPVSVHLFMAQPSKDVKNIRQEPNHTAAFNLTFIYIYTV